MKFRTGSYVGYLRFGLKAGRRKPNAKPRQSTQNLHPQHQTVGARMQETIAILFIPQKKYALVKV
jgi:hypothetical protein